MERRYNMEYVKIDENTYKSVTEKVYHIDEIQKEIDDLRKDITDSKNRKLEYPEGVSNDMKQAIDTWNNDLNMQVELLEQDKIENEYLLKEIIEN